MARSRIAINLDESGRTGSGGRVRVTGTVAVAGLVVVRAERLFPHPVTSKEMMTMAQRVIVPRP
jgi:hypothetical protein